SLKNRGLSAQAQVHLRHHGRPISSGFVTSPAAHLGYTADGTALFADEAGMITTESSDSTALLTISGRYITIINEDGTPLEHYLDPFPAGGAFSWEREAEFDQAQLDAYTFVHNCRESALTISRDVPWVDEPLTVRVNAEGSCNAWYNGGITFLKAGDVCPNTAMIGDIAYHEYGHGFHMNSIIEGVGEFDGSVGEGFADIYCALITGDHNMAPEFFPGAPNLRDLEADKSWPWDLNIFNEVHENGLIVGTTLWDLWKAFRQVHGDEEGTLLFKRIYGQIVKTTTDILSLYENVLIADDDDGDLENGTPNICSIVKVFAAHGLMDMIAFTPPGVHHIPDVSVTTPLRVSFSEVFDQCVLTDITRGSFRYSTDEGQTWTEHDIVLTGERRFDVVLPAPGKAGRVLYAFTLEDTAGNRTYNLPANAAEPYYMLYAGPLTTIYSDDFEEETPGWAHELVDGIDQPAADDWQRGTPKGDAGDPVGAYSGEYAWGNDLSDPDRWNGAYKPNIINRLTSPSFDLSDYTSVRLQFRRWLVIEDGKFDHARIYVNDQVVWSNRATVEGKGHHQDKEWVLFDLDISTHAAGQRDVTITWELESDGGNEYGGWTIDDFALVTTDDLPATQETDDDGCTCRAGTGRTRPAHIIWLLSLILFAATWRRAVSKPQRQ
ncbi:hypothetical protein KJ865_04180, partial [Myxococcota bacterium]|nr:hypothetical protein [Myxococcota bacterium]